MEIAERPIHEVFAYERDFRIPLLPPPSIRSSADKSMDTKQGGASPKRKAEDDVMEVSGEIMFLLSFFLSLPFSTFLPSFILSPSFTLPFLPSFFLTVTLQI